MSGFSPLRILFLAMTASIPGEIHAQFDSLPQNFPEHKLHEWLSWGEFDSVVSVLEPALRQDTALPSPRPVPWVWLGLAYHGLNRTQAGDEAFRKAILSDTAVPWETALASPEINLRFQKILEIEMHRRRAADSIATAHSETRTTPTTNTAASRTGTRRAVVWAAAGTSLIAAGGALAWWLWKNDAPTREHITSIGPAPRPE